MTPKVIEEGGPFTLTLLLSNCWQADSAWNYQALFELRNIGTSKQVKLKVVIRKSTEPSDCVCSILIFDHTKWNVLHAIPFSYSNAKQLNYDDATESETRRLFEKDQRELLAIAQRLVF